ncbi:MAG TPA: GNAT family N-acetyltransferase [Vicinamibacterales bacterium]|nr:GNAT family N-acetyltransferase [Vicinamibacterales bacterium]
MTLQLLKSVDEKRDELAALLVDCVESGASIGFLPPLPISDAHAYWEGLAPELRSGSRLLLVALGDRVIVGAVQLALCTKKNGVHRAEVEKLMVHTQQRRAGIGRALLERIEQVAKEQRRTLLVLDTRSDDTASILCSKCAYIEAGRIPAYASSAAGTLDGTTYFYKQL